MDCDPYSLALSTHPLPARLSNLLRHQLHPMDLSHPRPRKVHPAMSLPHLPTVTAAPSISHATQGVPGHPSRSKVQDMASRSVHRSETRRSSGHQTASKASAAAKLAVSGRRGRMKVRTRRMQEPSQRRQNRRRSRNRRRSEETARMGTSWVGLSRARPALR